MAKRLDQPTLCRLDNAAVIKFLTSTAAVFAANNSLSPNDADELRLSLTGLQLSEGRQGSVLSQLHDQNSEFLAMLIARFGAIGLCQNIFRFTLKRQLYETLSVLSDLGEKLLEKSKVFFNRPFYIYVGGQCETRSSFGTILVDMAQTIHDACDSIENVQKKLSVLQANHINNPQEADENIDQQICLELGLDSWEKAGIPFINDLSARNELTSCLQLMVAALSEVTDQIRYNHVKDGTAHLAILLDNISSNIQTIATFNFPRTDDIDAWELRRHLFLDAVIDVTDFLKDFTHEFENRTTRVSILEGATKQAVSQDVLRGMTTTMIQTGTAASKAKEAACALVNYCETNQVPPKEILPGELNKIDPNLSVQSLKLLQEISDDKYLNKTAVREKKNTAKRNAALLEQFHQKLSQLGVLCLPLLFILSGCGVKLVPKSDLIDYRPAVRYHTKRAMPDYLKKNSNKKKELNKDGQSSKK